MASTRPATPPAASVTVEVPAPDPAGTKSSGKPLAATLLCELDDAAATGLVGLSIFHFNSCGVGTVQRRQGRGH
jgi:hypothetical protein